VALGDEKTAEMLGASACTAPKREKTIDQHPALRCARASHAEITEISPYKTLKRAGQGMPAASRADELR
jgi:hypothetical protein